MDYEKRVESLDLAVDSINSQIGTIQGRIGDLESNLARLAVLVNAIRQCVDTQTNIFNSA